MSYVRGRGIKIAKLYKSFSRTDDSPGASRA